MGPRMEPPTEEKTTNATAYCCVSASHMSAIMPRVTDPPAEERPPRARPTMMVPKFGASATGSCQMLTKNRLSCRTGLRPNSSDLFTSASSSEAWRRSESSPRRPQLAAEGVCDEEDGGTHAGGLCAHAVLGRDASIVAIDGVGVKGGIEVHRDLDDEDDGEDVPFLGIGEAEAQFVVTIIFGELVPVVGAELLQVGAVGLLVGEVIGRLALVAVFLEQFVGAVQIGLVQDLGGLFGEARLVVRRGHGGGSGETAGGAQMPMEVVWMLMTGGGRHHAGVLSAWVSRRHVAAGRTDDEDSGIHADNRVNAGEKMGKRGRERKERERCGGGGGAGQLTVTKAVMSTSGCSERCFSADPAVRTEPPAGAPLARQKRRIGSHEARAGAGTQPSRGENERARANGRRGRGGASAGGQGRRSEGGARERERERKSRREGEYDVAAGLHLFEPGHIHPLGPARVLLTSRPPSLCSSPGPSARPAARER
nr:hypothetical protein CFP56_70019 [Quercus suber]